MRIREKIMEIGWQDDGQKGRVIKGRKWWREGERTKMRDFVVTAGLLFLFFTFTLSEESGEAGKRWEREGWKERISNFSLQGRKDFLCDHHLLHLHRQHHHILLGAGDNVIHPTYLWEEEEEEESSKSDRWQVWRRSGYPAVFYPPWGR